MTDAFNVIGQTALARSGVVDFGTVALEGWSEEELLEHEVAVEGPGELVGVGGVAVLGGDGGEAVVGVLDEGVVELDGVGDAGHGCVCGGLITW